jgi:hypothetical protein
MATVRRGYPSCPGLPQSVPADQRTPERQERGVNIGPLVVSDPQAPKLIQPGKCPFDDPTPAPEATPMRGAAHRDKRQNPTDSQAVAN